MFISHATESGNKLQNKIVFFKTISVDLKCKLPYNIIMVIENLINDFWFKVLNQIVQL